MAFDELIEAFCRAYLDATVVALEPWEPSLELARANVGAVITAADAITRLQGAGLADVREIPRAWNAPVELAVGRRG